MPKFAGSFCFVVGWATFASTTLATTPQLSPTPVQRIANGTNSTAEKSRLSILINGKEKDSLRLGDTYKIEISNVPKSGKLIGRCEGAQGCASWFLLGVNFVRPDANGNLKLPAQLPPNWNIPLTTYTFWVETENGALASNRVSLSLEAKIEKKRPFPPAQAGTGLRLLVEDAFETTIELGVGNAFYHVEGGLPGQLLIAHCDWPPLDSRSKNQVWLFPAGYRLDKNGMLDTSMGFGASMPPGKYVIWLTTEDGKFTSNKVTVNLRPEKK